MKKIIIRNTMIILTVLFFVISVSFFPVIADPGDGKGDGDGNTDIPTPPKDPNNDNQGNDNIVDQNQDGNYDEPDNQNNEHNENHQDDGNNQWSNQNREGDNDDVDHNRERYQNRNMEIEVDGNNLRIRSGWNQGDYEDEFEITFVIDDGPGLKLQYKNNKDLSQNELSFEVKVRELIEYRDANKNGRFDMEDNIINKYSFENSIFNNLTYQKQILNGNETINLVSTQTIDNVFSMNLYFSNNFSYMNNQILTPSEVKIDFLIDDFPYQEEDTQLCLKTIMQTRDETELNTESFDEKNGFSHGENVLDVNLKNSSGFFSWVETAIVDGVEKSVNTTIASQIEENIYEDEIISNQVNEIYFSYPRGINIIHDPKIGVVSISFEAYALQSISNLINVDNIFSYVGICVLASIVFLGIIFVRKRF
jgi:hypothetical protein